MVKDFYSIFAAMVLENNVYTLGVLGVTEGKCYPTTLSKSAKLTAKAWFDRRFMTTTDFCLGLFVRILIRMEMVDFATKLAL